METLFWNNLLGKFQFRSEIRLEKHFSGVYWMGLPLHANVLGELGLAALHKIYVTGPPAIT